MLQSISKRWRLVNSDNHDNPSFWYPCGCWHKSKHRVLQTVHSLKFHMAVQTCSIYTSNDRDQNVNLLTSSNFIWYSFAMEAMTIERDDLPIQRSEFPYSYISLGHRPSWFTHQTWWFSIVFEKVPRHQGSVQLASAKLLGAWAYTSLKD